MKYRYDIGANVEASSPAPAGNDYGKRSMRTFDGSGRLEKDAIWKYASGAWSEHSYQRYAYPTNGVQSKVYSTLVDTNGNNVGDASDEVLTESFADGAGRVRLSRVPHTFDANGVAATWAATLTEYDILGRVARQSVPTEVDSTWAATGDDAARGFLWSYQKYDWKNRVVRKINTDGEDQAALNDSDVLISYDGCGCAGGQVTTVEGEMVPRDDVPTTNARRKQKVYEDILGRTFKTETFEWDGTTVYSTTVNTFNGRDQVIRSRQFAGDASGTVYQDTTAAFDGHGRVYQTHRPEQRDAGGSLKYTAYSYNEDDSIESVTDGRGAVTNYEYNLRSLLTKKSWTVPTGSGITDPPDVTLAYDNTGNRTSMTDALGTVDYTYNSLSQLTSELRKFDDTLASAPEPNNGFKIDYTYHLGGQLKSLKEPFGVEAKYNLDKAGKLIGISPATTYGTTTVFTSNAQYRAFGGLKHLEYGNGMEIDQDYDNNTLRASSYELGDAQGLVMQKSYQYYADGNLKHVDDSLDGNFDRLNIYDHQGRIREGKSGAEANGSTQSGPVPYRQSYSFNAFGDLTERYNLQWGGGGPSLTKTYDFTNHRITVPTGQNQWQYDADGRVAVSGYPETVSEIEYDASGQLLEKHDFLALSAENKLSRRYDGEGREAKRLDSECRLQEVQGQPPPTECTWNQEEMLYYIRSTVLGGEVIAETNSDGSKRVRYVCVGGGVVAILRENYIWQQGGGYSYDAAYFEHTDSSGMSFRTTKKLTPANWWDFSDERQAEFDAGDANVGLTASYSPQPGQPGDAPISIESESPLYIDGQIATATVDGVEMSWQIIQNMAAAGALQINRFWKGQRMPPADVYATLGGIYFDNNIRFRESRDPGFYNPNPTIDTTFIDLKRDAPEIIFSKFQFFKSVIETRVNFIGKPHGLVMSNREALIARLTWLIGLKDCNDNFKTELGKTPFELIMERGLSVTDYGSLEDPRYSAEIGISESDRVGLLAHRDNKQPHATTTRDLPIGIVTIFNENQIDVSWLWSFFSGTKEEMLNEIIPHEFIHGAGKGKDHYAGGALFSGHDLNNWRPYNRVVDSCMIPGGKRVF